VRAQQPSRSTHGGRSFIAGLWDEWKNRETGERTRTHNPLLDLARDERDHNRGAEGLWKTEVDGPGAKPCARGPLMAGDWEGADNGAGIYGAGIFCTLGLGKFRICALAAARGAAASTSAAMKRARGCMENSCSCAPVLI
jgi:hypothetical protein